MKIGELKDLIHKNELQDDCEIIFQSTMEDFSIPLLCQQLDPEELDLDVMSMTLNTNIQMAELFIQTNAHTGEKSLLVVCDVKIEEIE